MAFQFIYKNTNLSLKIGKRLMFCLFFLAAVFFQLSAQESTGADLATKQAGSYSEIDALNKNCNRLILQKKYQQADIQANEAIIAANNAGYTKGIADANYNLGLLSRQRFDYKHAVEFYVASIKGYNTLNDRKNIATLKNLIGEVFLLQKDELNAIKNFKDAHEIFTGVNDLRGQAQSLEWTGKAYLQQKIYGQATESLKRSMDTWIEAEETEKAASIATLLAKVSYELGDYEGALVYNNASLDMHGGLNQKEKIAADFAMMANIYMKTNDLDGAIEANKMSENIRLELKDNFGLADVYRIYGAIYQLKKDFGQADDFFSKSKSILVSLPFQSGIPEQFKFISDSYSHMGQPEKALEMLHLFISSKDSLFNVEKSTAMLELTTKYESEFSIKEKNEKIEQLNKDRANERLLRYFMIGLIGLMLLLSYSLYTNFRRKHKDNQLLTSKNDEIQLQNLQIQSQKESLDIKNLELAEINQKLEEKNVNLDLLNQQLITEMAERESLEKSSFARDHFLATVSHTMRNPLNAIIGLSHQLSENNKDTKQSIFLRDLQFAANDLVVLINDLLDYSRIEAGKLTLDNREFSIMHVTKEITSYFKTQKQIAVNFQKSKELPEKLWGDSSRLNQIITNIINHLSKGYESSTYSISLSSTVTDENHIHLDIVFKSNESTFNNDILNTMYELFKGHPSVSENDSDNTGGKLSLAITKRLIELQNGSVQIIVNKQNAVEISISLPYKLSNGKNAVREKIIDQDGKLKDKNILVVEDNRINQLVVVNLLRKYGVDVTTAENGLYALDAVSKKDFDLILMDILMPEMDGYRATAQIRKMNNKIKSNTPIIALTASAFLTEKEKAHMFGMTDYIGKPFAPEELIDKIIEVIDHHQKSFTASQADHPS